MDKSPKESLAISMIDGIMKGIEILREATAGEELVSIDRETPNRIEIVFPDLSRLTLTVTENCPE